MNLTISALSERIAAQTEAYMEFSNALIKIIENSAAMRDQLSENSNLLKVEYNNLLIKTHELLTMVTSLLNSTSEDNNVILKDLSDFKKIIESLEKRMIQIYEENAELNEQSQTKIDLILSKIETTNKEINEVSNFRIKAKYILASLASVITFILVLDGFGVIKISWFTK